MKKIFISIACVFSVLMLCSCEDQLTTHDATKVDSSTFTTSAGFEPGLDRHLQGFPHGCR